MCAMMPRTDKLPGIGDTDVAAFLRKMRAEAEPLYWLGLVAGAALFAITPLLTIGVPLPAFWLPRGLLEKHSQRILSHSSYTIRQGVFLVRLSAGMCWGADPNVRARLALAPCGADPGTFRTT